MNEHQSTDDVDQPMEMLVGMAVDAPGDSMERFRRRAKILQGARVLFEKQVFGFWIVLNTFLKLLFKRFNVPVAPVSRDLAERYSRAGKHRRG
jgi:hypothetical protein